MVDLAGLYVFFGAGAFIIIKFFLGFLLKEQGLMRLIITLVIGLGMLGGAAAIAPTCAPAAIILVVGAIVFGGLPVVVLFMFAGSIPFLGPAFAGVLEPISGLLFILLILAIVEFIVHILSILAIVPILGMVVIILNIALPLIQLFLLWGPFSDGFANLTRCFDITGQVIPGTGGISIGA
jgi:hypothetical protein